jgi:hypothetical protein
VAELSDFGVWMHFRRLQLREVTFGDLWVALARLITLNRHQILVASAFTIDWLVPISADAFLLFPRCRLRAKSDYSSLNIRN